MCTYNMYVHVHALHIAQTQSHIIYTKFGTYCVHTLTLHYAGAHVVDSLKTRLKNLWINYDGICFCVIIGFLLELENIGFLVLANHRCF